MNIPGVANGISDIAGEMVLPDGTRKVLSRAAAAALRLGDEQWGVQV